MKTLLITKPVGCWFPGDVAGFSDDFADKLIASGAGQIVAAEASASTDQVEPSEAASGADAADPADSSVGASEGASTDPVEPAEAASDLLSAAVDAADPSAERRSRTTR